MKKKDETVEMLDFDDTASSLDETVEMLDFETDLKVSSEIDEMLDFIDISVDNSKNKEEADKLVDNSIIENNISKIEIDAEKEKLDEYNPTIKDFNIKSARTRKIVRNVMVYTVIVMLLGFELFINKTGRALNDIRVYASDNDPIKIIQNDKYGYIDYTGTKIVNPKYSYGEDFIDGYAIVKDAYNMPMIIDKGGKIEVPTGKYFTIYRAGTDIVAAKTTKKGLKYGILDSRLKNKTDFNYDNITYADGAYTFVSGNDVGLINLDGKEIFRYKLTDTDDKDITINSSKNNSNNIRYAIARINSSSFIINLSDGTIVTNATLKKIVPEDNNVFYYDEEGNSKNYMYVNDNKVVIESIDYLSITADSINNGVVKALNNNHEYEYISAKTGEKLEKKLNDNDVFYGEDIFMYKKHNFKTNKDILIMIKNGEKYKELNYDFEVIKPFVNGAATIKYSDGTYGYLNESGEFITDIHFDEVNDFDEFGDAIVKTKNGYGVLNIKGKTIIPFTNKAIKMANYDVKFNSIGYDNIFYAVKKDNRFGLYNSKGKKVNKKFYNDVVFDKKYPVIKVSTDKADELVIAKNLETINLTSFNLDYEAFENYIAIKNEYYNYNGKNIYIDKRKGE